MRRTLLIAFAAVAVTASPAFAEKLPQLDPVWFASQLFWLAITFTALVVVVRFRVAPGVGSVLEQRKTVLERELHEAESFKASAEATRGNFEEAMFEARQKSTTMLTEAKRQIAAETGAGEAKHAAEIAARITATEQQAAKAVRHAIAESGASVAGLVEAMTEKLLGQSVEQSEAQRAVKKVA